MPRRSVTPAGSLDQRVGLLDEAHHRRHAVGVLEVDTDGTTAAVHRLEVRLGEVAGDGLGAL